MHDFFKPDFFGANRRRLYQRCEADLIVVSANGLLQRGGDSTFPFAQDANFWYLTGLDEPDLLLVIHGDSEYLVAPGRSVSRVAFDGALSGDALSRISGIATVLDDQAGWKRLGQQLKTAQALGMPAAAGTYIEPLGLYTNPARARTEQRIKKLDPRLEIQNVNPALFELRAVKQPEELKAIQKAIDITVETLAEVTKPAQLAAYRREYELEADIGRGFRRRGAEGHAFEPIVAGGRNACTLHYVANNDRLHEGTLAVIDVGAQASHYAADITRTVSLGRPTKRQQAVYTAVLEVQNYARGLIKPGVLLKDYEHQVVKFMGGKLQELGLITKNSPENVRRYYPHATSHFLGLNVHDAGNYRQPLQPGMVLTVEPGIYVAEEGLGVRLEDDVLVTETGLEVLSDKLPRVLS